MGHAEYVYSANEYTLFQPQSVVALMFNPVKKEQPTGLTSLLYFHANELFTACSWTFYARTCRNRVRLMLFNEWCHCLYIPVWLWRASSAI